MDMAWIVSELEGKSLEKLPKTVKKEKIQKK